MNKPKTVESFHSLSFDGCGINGRDEYRTRIATFNDKNIDGPRYGRIFAASEAMLEALQAIISCPDYCYNDKGTIRATADFRAAMELAVVAVNRASGVTS